MAFQSISTRRHSGYGHKVTLSAYSHGSQGSFYPRLNLPEKMAKSMGWRQGGCVSFAIGTGRDLGWMRVKNGAGGTHRLGKNGPSRIGVNLPVGKQPKRHDSEEVQYKTHGDALFIKMPAWLQIA